MLPWKLHWRIRPSIMQLDDYWCFNIGASRHGKEIYCYVNIWKWSLAIGRFYDEEKRR